MPTKDDEEVWTPSGSLSHDGKIEGVGQSDNRRNNLDLQLNPPPHALDLMPLELAERQPKQAGSAPEEPRREDRRHRPPFWMPIAIGAGVLVACTVVLLLLLVLQKPLQRASTAQATAKTEAPANEKLAVPDESEGAPSLTVQSDPPGAMVFIEGEESGSTPLLGSNEFAKGSQVRLRLELKGYRSWTGTFAGGLNAAVRAKLQRR
jgi:hypothetical protein